MDRYLQRLKRAAINDPAAQARYIAALERALGGEREEHPELEDSNIGSVDEGSEAFEDLLELLPVIRVGDAHGNRIGVMIEVYWEGSEPDDEAVAEIEAALSDASRQLLIDAADQGYHFLIYWR